MTDNPLRISRVRHVTYRKELDQPVVEQPALLQENNPIQEKTSEPETARLVNPFHNTIYLSTSEGKKLYQKVTAGLPEAEKHTGDSKHAIKLVERVESQCKHFGWKKSGEKVGDDNLSVFKTLGTLNIDAVKAHCDPKWLASTKEQDLEFCIMSNMMFSSSRTASLSPFSMILKKIKPNGQDLEEEMKLCC